MNIGRPFLQKISLRPRESGLAARASHSAVSVDFPEASLSVTPSAYALLVTASKVVFNYIVCTTKQLAERLPIRDFQDANTGKVYHTTKKRPGR